MLGQRPVRLQGGAARVGRSGTADEGAVLAFRDGTEDFRQRGGLFADHEHLIFNLAKTGFGGFITALTPDLWARAFADDLSASGAFRAVRFIYDPSELQGEEIRIEGTVVKAYAFGAYGIPNEFTLALKATRGDGNRTAWEKEVARLWKTDQVSYERCGVSRKCLADLGHAM